MREAEEMAKATDGTQGPGTAAETAGPGAGKAPGAGEAAWPPPGYMEDAAGRLVPERCVGELDKLRDELARELVAEAEELAGRLAGFRRSAAERVRSMVELAAQEHGVRPRSERGAVTLTSYDGTATGGSRRRGCWACGR